MARVALLLALLLASGASLAAQPAPAPAPAPAADVPASGPLPVDPAVTTGTLPNGVRYYIRQNTRPEDRVMLRLVVKAGSVFEDDDQRGLAHFLEHMAFNGTEHFEPGELVAFFERIGARFGPHVNAYTSFDETVYMLQVPTDEAGLVDRGLLALADFAGGITLDPAEIDKERGVVIEEWRLRLGATWRILEEQAPVLYHDSRYAERLPIGTPEVLRTFPPERLRAFYETWYRPGRMAVIVVGDVDPDTILPRVRELFGAQRAEAPEEPEPPRGVPPHEATLVSVATDPEAQASTVSVLHKRPKLSQGSVEDYRRDLVRQLMYQMLNLRFSEIAQRPDAPFLGAGAGSQDIAVATAATSLSARVQDGALGPGLEALIVEARRARDHGFTEAELDRARARLLAAYERAYNEREKTESGSYAAEYTRNFLEGEPIPGIALEYALVDRIAGGITLDETAAAARELLLDTSRVVLATSPEREGLAVPSEADLREVIAAASARPVTPWTETLSRTELLPDRPEPGRITGSRELSAIGVTVLTLSNGSEVWLKPTDFQNDQVLIGGVALGGASTAPRDEYFDTVLSSSLVGLAGVGGLSPPELTKVLAGRMAGVSAFVDLTTHGLRGSSRPQDLEAAFQLLYLTVTQPNTDERGFDLLKRQLSALVANREQNPQAVFRDRLRALNSGGHYMTRPLSAEVIASLDRETMAQAFRSRFANAADFTFFVVGAFDPQAIRPLLEQYVASLPSTGERRTSVEPLGFEFPAGTETLTVERGREPRSETVLTFFADTDGNEREEWLAGSAADLLQIKLRDILREDLGGTYGVSAGYSSLMPDPTYATTSVSFGSSPDNAPRLSREVLAEIERLASEGPTPDDVVKVREQERRELQVAERQNGYWLASLQGVVVNGRDPASLAQRMARIDRLTAEALKEAITRYFPRTRYTHATLLPDPAAVSNQEGTPGSAPRP
jgi:zinc protease